MLELFVVVKICIKPNLREYFIDKIIWKKNCDLSLNIFYCRKGTLQSNNTITQSNRIRTKAGSLYSSSPDHE